MFRVRIYCIWRKLDFVLEQKTKLFTYGTINSESEIDANEIENYRMVATFRANNMNFIVIQTKARIDRSSLFDSILLNKEKSITKSKRKVKNMLPCTFFD